MPNNYDNIDYCLNVLYDFVYGKSTTCYKLKYESLKNVSIDNLKKNSDFDVSKIFQGIFTFVNENHNNLIFKRSSKSSYLSMVRIGMYSKKNTNLHDLNRNELIDMKMNYSLSELAINDPYKLRYIMLPIFNFDISYNEMKQNDKNKSIIKEIDKKYKDIKKDDVMYVQIFEHYFKLKTLKEYLDEHSSKMNIIQWKNICFQILYILYRIQNAHSEFKHNMLDIESIYVYETKNTDKIKEIKIQNQTFHLPNLGIELKITNFYKSTMNTETENPYYDIHYFLSSMYYHILNNKLDQPKLIDFINKIIPDKFKSSNEKNIGLDEEYYKENVGTILNPTLILTKNNFFVEFIKGNITNMNSPMSNSPKNLSEYQNLSSSVDYMLSSSLSENGYGTAPSNLAQKRNSINGVRSIPSKLSNLQGGGAKKKSRKSSKTKKSRKSPKAKKSRKSHTNKRKRRVARSFNDFGEPTEKPVDSESDEETSEETSEEATAGPTDGPTEETSEEETSEEETSEEETSEEETSEEEDKKQEEITENGGPLTERPPAGANAFFSMMNGKNPYAASQKKNKNNMFSGIESMAKSNSKEAGTFMKAHKKSKKKSKKGKKGRKGKRGRKSSMVDNQLESAVLSKLPNDYEGMLPAWMQSVMPGTPGGSGGMPGMGMPGMPQGGMPGMPQMGMPGMPQGGMPQMGMPGMPQMGMPGMPQGGMPGMPQGGMPGMPQMGMPGMPQGGMPGMPQMGVPGMGAPMSPMAGQGIMGIPESGSANSAKADMFNEMSAMKSSLPNMEAGEQSHTNLLPSHLLMGQNQGPPAQAQAPAQAPIAQAQVATQQGGSGSDFFF
jgi:hypothetical protein